jgi:hypothetical protein
MNNPQRISAVRVEAAGDGLAVRNLDQDTTYILNSTTAMIWQQCDGQTNHAALAERVERDFGVGHEPAEEMVSLALEELGQADLLREREVMAAAPSRRQLLRTLAAAGLSVALLPVAAPVTALADALDVVPILECVSDNGDGTFTALFGYRNEYSTPVTIAIGTNNAFSPAPIDRGQPTAFQPGRQVGVFSAGFRQGGSLVWALKYRSNQHAMANDKSPRCAPTTTTPMRTTTTPRPSSTTVAPI